MAIDWSATIQAQALRVSEAGAAVDNLRELFRVKLGMAERAPRDADGEWLAYSRLADTSNELAAGLELARNERQLLTRFNEAAIRAGNRQTLEPDEVILSVPESMFLPPTASPVLRGTPEGGFGEPLAPLPESARIPVAGFAQPPEGKLTPVDEHPAFARTPDGYLLSPEESRNPVPYGAASWAPPPDLPPKAVGIAPPGYIRTDPPKGSVAHYHTQETSGWAGYAGWHTHELTEHPHPTEDMLAPIPYPDPARLRGEICWREFRWPDHKGKAVCGCRYRCQTTTERINRAVDRAAYDYETA